MSRVTPSARTWTLRFKNNTSTILLEVDPLQKLADVRAELLHALVETTPGGKLNGHDIPKNADHIKLGFANDRNDLSKGYSSVGRELEEVSEGGKGKGKVAASKPKTGFAALKDCPQGVGLKNGDVVAFKFDPADGSKIRTGRTTRALAWTKAERAIADRGSSHAIGLSIWRTNCATIKCGGRVFTALKAFERHQHGHHTSGSRLSTKADSCIPLDHFGPTCDLARVYLRGHWLESASGRTCIRCQNDNVVPEYIATSAITGNVKIYPQH